MSTYSEMLDVASRRLNEEMVAKMNANVRTFETGATRDTDQGKLDYEACLSPIVLERYAQYMLKHCKQADGTIRGCDNWQLGIPKDQYMKSLARHFMDVWKLRDGYPVEGVTLEDALCAVMFNAMGMLFETLKER